MAISFEAEPRGYGMRNPLATVPPPPRDGRSRPASPAVLDGLAFEMPPSSMLPLRVMADHLTLLGARPTAPRAGDTPPSDPCVVGRTWLGTSPAEPAVRCTVRWQPADDPAGPSCRSESGVQALSGLMAVHGRDRLAPEPIGLHVASIAAGVLAVQGALAAVLGERRGLAIRTVETSVLQGALQYLRHHVAIATCGGESSFPEPGPTRAPPFPTADGGWIELEALDFDSWRRFWSRLQPRDVDLMEAWITFVYRYVSGRCGLPDALTDATRQHDTDTLVELAAECGAAACRLRSLEEVFGDSTTSSGRGLTAAGVAAPWARVPGPDISAPTTVVPPLGPLPLSGLRVVESTSRLQGPLAGALLQELGAEVVKVEAPGGDFTRRSPPLAGDLGAGYLAYNSGKRVVELDYKTRSGRADLLDLLTGADVFLHNWKAGRAERLDLSADRLLTANPTLVYAQASGWGPDPGSGPTPIAGDYLVQAHAACGEGLRPPGEPPFPSRVTLVDAMGGLLACEAILAALCDRERSGTGSRVDTSLFAAALVLQGHLWATGPEEACRNRRKARSSWSSGARPRHSSSGYVVDSGDGAVPVTERMADLRATPAVGALLEPLGGSALIPGPPWRFNQ